MARPSALTIESSDFTADNSDFAADSCRCTIIRSGFNPNPTIIQLDCDSIRSEMGIETAIGILRH